MMVYLLFLLFQCVLFVLFWRLVKGKRCFFFQAFYFFFSLLLVLPFFLIFADCQGLISLTSITSRAFHGTASLARGTGVRPVSVLLLFQVFFLVGGCCVYSISSSQNKMVQQVPLDRYFIFAIMLGSIALGYMLARAYFVSDFPLISFFTAKEGVPLRDLAFSYGSKTNEIPYFFRPSITSLFYRAMLPLSGMMFFILGKQKYRPKLTYSLSAIIFIFSFAFLVGTMKRTPILFFATWCFITLLLSNSSKIKRKFFIYSGLTVLFLCLSTTAYNTSIDVLFERLFRRIFIVEGLKEFLCIEHYGTTFDYLGFDIPMRYIHKIFGEDVLTFSQVWKKQLGGSRGWSSIGIMAEFFASFGFFVASFAYMFWGALLMMLDVVSSEYRSSVFYLPFLSCLITIIAFSSTKGILSQMFTGGGGVLIVLTLCLFIISKPCTKSTTHSVYVGQ